MLSSSMFSGSMFSSSPRIVFRSTTLRSAIFLLLTVFPALLLPLGSASAQGSFTTNKSFLLSVDKSHNFTLSGIPVVYKPLSGAATSGFLTLSGNPTGHSLILFHNVHLSFSPTQGGQSTIADTFSAGTVTPLGNNLYCLASIGRNSNGNSFTLYGGFTKSASSSTSLSALPAAPAHAASANHAASTGLASRLSFHR